MTKQEFLSTLRGRLTGEISSREINENIQYYDDYITEEARKGRTEYEVIQEIGGAHLVAKSIIEAHGNEKKNNAHNSSSSESESFYSTNGEYSYDGSDQKKGFNANYTNAGWDIRYGQTKLNTWYWKLLAIVALIIVAILITKLLGAMLSVLVPIFAPVILVLVIYNLVRGHRRR